MSLVYYLRIHDSTVHAPDYLAADLFLGRRQQPVFKPDMETAILNPMKEQPARLTVRVWFENIGLAWVDRPIAGFVGWVLGQHPLSESLSREVRRIEHPTWKLPTHFQAEMNYGDNEDAKIPPFRRFYADAGRMLDFPFNGKVEFLWAAGLYVVAYNQEPVWFQVVVHVFTKGRPEIWVFPCEDRKPIAGLHTFADQWMPAIDWATWNGKPTLGGVSLNGFRLIDEDE